MEGHARQEEVDRAASEVAVAEANVRTAQEDLLTRRLEYEKTKAQIDSALKYGDWSLAERAADHLEAFTGPEPLPWTNFHIGRGRLISYTPIGWVVTTAT